MDHTNSSLARVQPVFDELLERRPFGDPWLQALWEMASRTRPGVATKVPSSSGTLLIEEAPSEREARAGKVYDRPLAPPAAFLRWLLENPGRMHVVDPDTFGAKSEDVRAWRRKLFSGVPTEVALAQAEGVRQLESRLAQRGRNKWWLFEGFARVSACFVTDECVIVVEDHRPDMFASSTQWFPQRSQLWRTVEAASELAGGKRFGVILAVPTQDDGAAALANADGSLDASVPHLEAYDRAELARHFLGFITWTDIVARFNLPPVQAPAM